MIKRKFIIKNKNDFKEIFSSGQKRNYKNLTFIIKKNSLSFNRYAVCVSKNKIRLAVVRNKIKRIIKLFLNNHRSSQKEKKANENNDTLIFIKTKLNKKNIECVKQKIEQELIAFLEN